MEHTLTLDDVKRIYVENLAQGKSPREARQGTRTEVHLALQLQSPIPYPLPPPSRAFNVSGIVTCPGCAECQDHSVWAKIKAVFGIEPSPHRIHDEGLGRRETAARQADIADRKARVHELVTDEEVKAANRAHSGIDGSHVNAHHWVQKQHGIGLWQEADRLVGQALGGVS